MNITYPLVGVGSMPIAPALGVSTKSGLRHGITLQYISGREDGPGPGSPRPRDRPRMISLWSRVVYPDAGYRLTFTRYPVPQTFQILGASKGWGSGEKKAQDKGTGVGKAV